MSSLKLFQDKLALNCFYNEKELAKEIKDGKWNKLHKVWIYPCNKTKLTQLKNTFPNIYVSKEVEAKVKEVEEIRQRALTLKTLNDYDLDCSFLKTQPYNFQKAGIAFMLNQDSSMNFDEMGCLAGDTKIKVNRGGNCRTYNLRTAFRGFHTIWKTNSTIQSEQDGFLRLNIVKDIIFSGFKKIKRIHVKERYKIGKSRYYRTISIGATDDHLFLTSKGYVPVSKLKVGTLILMNGLKYCKICKKHTYHTEGGKFKNRCQICIYRLYRKNNIKKEESIDKDGYIRIAKYIRNHPSLKDKKCPFIYKHRLIYEAFLNKVSYNKWIDIIQYNKFTKKYKFLPNNLRIHHIDGNKLNDNIENLKLVNDKEYSIEHKIEKNFGTFIPRERRITRIISPKNKVDVYDIKMRAPYHNFVANSFIVHNCGKTLQALTTAIIRKQRGEVKRALIICPVSMKQVWKQEIEKHSYEKAMVVEGNKTKRLQAYKDFKNSNIFFLVMNYEAIRIDIDILKEMCN